MNRRSFFTKLGLAAASIGILPAATTYVRKWKPLNADRPYGLVVPNPAWADAPYEIIFLFSNASYKIEDAIPHTFNREEHKHLRLPVPDGYYAYPEILPLRSTNPVVTPESIVHPFKQI